MSSVNKVVLVGRLGKDPEIKRTETVDVANFSLATSERWVDRASGEKRERTEWHRVASFCPRTNEFIERYVGKGAQVYVEGQLATRKYTDNAGVEKRATEIQINKVRGDLRLLSDGRSRAEADKPVTQPDQTVSQSSGQIPEDIPF